MAREKARTMKATEAQNKQLQKQKGKGSSRGKFPCTDTYFLLCHCFAATTLSLVLEGDKKLSPVEKLQTVMLVMMQMSSG